MPTTPPLPRVRTVTMGQPLQWLALGWRDMRQAGWISVVHGLVVSLGGGILLWLAHAQFWLLAGAISSFFVVAPILATSLYALSRAMERQEKAGVGVVYRTWLYWQRSHPSKWGNDYWCLVQFGSLLALAAAGWILTSAALITLLAPAPILTPLDFVRHVVLAREGYLFELWLALGGLLAAPLFASSVVSIPLLLDRRVTLWQAVLTSWGAVLANPITLSTWAACIMLLALLGLATLFVGMVFIIPLLGHGSWHAYRALVDTTGMPERAALSSPLKKPEQR